MVAEAAPLPTRRPRLYRVRQFFRALAARPLSPAEQEEVSTLLTAPQRALFDRLGRCDRRHSLAVMRTLAAAGETNRDLLVAALLHDVGKSCHRLRLWERPLVVLIRAYRPGVLRHWGRGEPRGWKRPFVIYAQHPLWGAEMATQVGCSPLTIWLIRHHQDLVDVPSGKFQGGVGLLRTLQEADGAN